MPAGQVRARALGDDYQYRYFWIHAAGLLFPTPHVVRVGMEQAEVRAFDDVVSYFAAPRSDAHGRSIESCHYQLKFHVDGRDEIRGTDLADPKFIGSKHTSLLQHAYAATGGGEVPRQFAMVTTWAIDGSDPLRKLISHRYGEILLAPLLEAGPRSELGELRTMWQTHLGLTNPDDLGRVLRHLKIRDNRWFEDVDEILDSRLRLAGLTPVDPGQRDHRYSGLALRFIEDRTLLFDADALRRVCDQEGLWASAGEDVPAQIGIKSFAQSAAPLEDEADVLDLVPQFFGRERAEGVDWDRDIGPRLQAFLTTVASGGRYDLHLDCHASLAYAAGWGLAKTDADVAPVQRLRSTRVVWRSTAEREPSSAPQWVERVVEVGAGPDLAVALSATWDVLDDVVLYVKASLPSVGRVLALTVADGASQASVHGADHAMSLAHQSVASIRRTRSAEERQGQLHLFAATPNGLLFFMGRESRVLGPTTVYEYGFDDARPGDYNPGLSVPIRL